MLALDQLQSGAAELLRTIALAGHKTVAATLRQHPDRARKEARRLGIFDFIEEILVSSHAEAGEGKASGVLAYARRQDLLPLVWVGDTEVDAAAAATLGVPCALVANGVRAAAALRGLPCIGVFDSLQEIPRAYFRCS
jgi:phosphoglycolate phosphatase-like HAD superfamily hydrolase